METISHTITHVPAAKNWEVIQPTFKSAERKTPIAGLHSLPVIAWLVETHVIDHGGDHISSNTNVEPVTIEGVPQRPFVVRNPGGYYSVPEVCSLHSEFDVIHWLNQELSR